VVVVLVLVLVLVMVVMVVLLLLARVLLSLLCFFYTVYVQVLVRLQPRVLLWPLSPFSCSHHRVAPLLVYFVS
jgi:hypothetical protein